ncbi:MAG: hypothetical protein NC311_02210 [Muribaculaceae bacterium]|nr:hypothetical protein [Muribaculaceae bacterium]
MKFNTTNFCSVSVLVAAMGLATGAFASQAPNPRSGVAVVSAPRSDATESRRASGNVVASTSGTTVSRAATRRATTSTVARGTISAPAVVNATVSRSGRTIRKAPSVSISSPVRGSASVSRAASSNVVRSATAQNVGSSARSATSSVSRAGMARATAVFDDVSKMGTGYSTCRDAYATCMDQLCAKANDTYRRCFCSARFTEFRDTEAALDEAKTLLMQFEDNNLNAVDKTAAEVNAMYSATVGEAAIKKDTSAAQKTLNEIGELLSGKKKATSSTSSSTSLGILSLDFTADVDDIWSGDGSDSLFGNLGGTVDLSQLEGAELYNQANAQCLKIVADSCGDKAVLNMAKSSYSILISQDCNAYEKKVESQRESVKQTVRTAEKYLREARLEEYRTHNSADVNECIAKVKNAITADTACGENYKKCLDYTGAYVDINGNAVPSQRLFELENLITLGGASAGTDLLGQNPQFNSFLDEKRMFATTALDTCRDMADIVWTEFKRSALIEIAQAQDALIENTKSTCVATMKECYDTQSDGLKSFDDTTAQAAGALSAYAAKSMCQAKVTACASLYGDTDGCSFDGNGKLVTANDASGKRCGLTALLNYVDTVDSVRVAEGCATAIDNYVKDLCTPTAGTMGFPWNCRTKEMGNAGDVSFKAGANASVADNIRNFAVQNCSDPTAGTNDYASLPLQTQTQVEKAINDIREQLEYQLMETCENLDGYWMDGDEENDLNGNPVKQLVAFYTTVYGNSSSGDKNLGQCVENTTMLRCLAYNTDSDGATPVASYDRTKDECTFTDAWYESQCNLLGNGYYENGVCYVAP